MRLRTFNMICHKTKTYVIDNCFFLSLKMTEDNITMISRKNYCMTYLKLGFLRILKIIHFMKFVLH